MNPDPQELKKTSLSPCPFGMEFWINNGPVVNNLRQLANELGGISDDSFHHHVSDAKDDFGAWIKEVFKNPSLANDLRYSNNVHDKNQYAKTIRDHLAWLESC